MIHLVYQPSGLFSKERLKNAIKAILGRQRGPIAVKNSLIRGLEKIGVDFRIGMRGATESDIVHVLTDAAALGEAIELKRQGKIRRLVAGPNVSVTPADHDGILLSPEIDMILQPAEWTRAFYVSEVPELAPKIRVWPSGVEDPYKGTKPVRSANSHAIIYQKNGTEELVKRIRSFLDGRGISHETIGYGSFKPGDYFQKLENSTFMVYLSASESQGLALHEAWMRDVPTLVWNRGYWEAGGHRFEDERISAPYLTDQCGLFFDEQNLEEKGAEFLKLLEEGSFSPRQYSLKNFTDEASARAYLGILESL